MAELVIAGLGAFCLYLGAHGAWTGSIETFSKRSSGMISASSSPVFFWITVALWLAGGVLMFSVACKSWRGK